MRWAPLLVALLACWSATAEPADTAAPKAVPKKAKAAKPPRVPRPTHPRLNEPSSGSEIVPRRDIPKELEKPEAPAPYLRWMLHPLRRGMWIRLPIMDTDPNRGITVGVMPIWVFKEDGGERIKQIHAPSLTYNRYFQATPTYRYYYYPQDDATLIARTSIGKYEREAMGHYEDRSFAGTPYDVLLRVQYNVDAGQRFFGVGPDSSRAFETNYKEDYLLVHATVGAPFWPGSNWRVHLSDWLQAEKLVNGPLPGLHGFQDTFPTFAAERRQQSNAMRLVVDYDSRDHPTTTTDGAFTQFYREQAVRGFASAYDYSRNGFDTRYFRRWDTSHKMVTAVGLKFEQLLGQAPFWLMPHLGGKYSLRSYGEGRYVDRSMIVANAEQRFTMFGTRMGGVTTEFELAPFVGLGTVADEPSRFSARYARPVFGTAVRAVARPQVVGSVDFGMGQEGLAVFMDINYAF